MKDTKLAEALLVVFVVFTLITGYIGIRIIIDTSKANYKEVQRLKEENVLLREIIGLKKLENK